MRLKLQVVEVKETRTVNGVRREARLVPAMIDDADTLDQLLKCEPAGPFIEVAISSPLYEEQQLGIGREIIMDFSGAPRNLGEACVDKSLRARTAIPEGY
jgi:hypothetical protein